MFHLVLPRTGPATKTLDKLQNLQITKFWDTAKIRHWPLQAAVPKTPAHRQIQKHA